MKRRKSVIDGWDYCSVYRVGGKKRAGFFVSVTRSVLDVATPVYKESMERKYLTNYSRVFIDDGTRLRASVSPLKTKVIVVDKLQPNELKIQITTI